MDLPKRFRPAAEREGSSTPVGQRPGIGRFPGASSSVAQGTASLVPVGLGERHAEPLNQFTEMNQFMFGIVRGRDLDTYR
jgi:hypothetical protein